MPPCTRGLKPAFCRRLQRINDTSNVIVISDFSASNSSTDPPWANTNKQGGSQTSHIMKYCPFISVIYHPDLHLILTISRWPEKLCDCLNENLESIATFVSVQEDQLWPTNRPTLDKISLTQNVMKHSFSRCAVESCPLVNDCDLLTGFSDFYLPLSHLTLSMSGISSSYRVHIWCGKTRMAALHSDEGRMMIDSVVWVQYINAVVLNLFHC